MSDQGGSDNLGDFGNYPGFGYDPFKYDTLIGPLDPFIGTAKQTQRMRAFCSISVDGINVTNQLDPFLISVRIREGTPHSDGEIELDDRDGRLPMPRRGAPVLVGLGWQTEAMVTVFRGLIQDVEHGFGRKQGGRRMWVHITGINFEGGAKTPIQDSKGEGAPPGQKEGKLIGLDSWLQDLGKHAGVKTDINSVFGKFKQDYWAAAGESPMHAVQSLADKFGFEHMWEGGDKLLIEKTGQRGMSCTAIWRDNLIAWRVRPYSARSTFKSAEQQFFDPKASHWNFKQQGFNLGAPWDGTTSTLRPQGPAETANAAGQSNEGAQQGAEASEFGNGRIIINGEPRARWNSNVLVVGARPGVDGVWFIKAVEHNYSRSGFITTLEVLPAATVDSHRSVSRGFLPRPQPNMG